MSQANIPNITPIITVTRDNAVNLLLSSIALEELGLSHILNAEAEKLQFVLGTLPGITGPGATIADVLNVNTNVRQMLQTIIQKEMLLNNRLDEVIELALIPFAPPPKPPFPPPPPPKPGALIANFSAIPATVANQPLPFDTTGAIIDSDIIHIAGSPDIILAPDQTFAVTYMIRGASIINQFPSFILTLNGAVIIGGGVTSGTLGGLGAFPEALTSTAIFSTPSGPPSVLNLRALLAGTQIPVANTENISITIKEL